MSGHRVGDPVGRVGSDFRFDGVVVAVFHKLSGELRYVVEDDRGVLFVQSDRNLEARDAPRPPSAWTLTAGFPTKVRNAVNNAVCRCADVGHRDWGDYGGRGIRVCAEWLADPRAFAAYLLSLPGHDVVGTLLDRLDNERGYEPGNLAFVTPAESVANRRPAKAGPKRRRRRR